MRDELTAWWNTRGLVLLLGAVATLVIVLAYAGPASTVVLYRLATDGLLALLWLACATAAGSLALALLRLPHSRTSETERSPGAGPVWFVSAAGLGIGLFSLCLLGLGLCGRLNRFTAIALLALGAVAGGGAAAIARRRGAGTSPVHHLTQRLRRPAGWGWAGLAVVPFLSMAVVGAMVPSGILWKPDEPHGYDVVEYHLQVPREWYGAGQITPLEHNAFSYFPFNVEMHYLLAMHLEGGPYAGMYLAQLMHLAMVGLTVLTVAAFAARLSGGRAGSATLAGVAAATVPWLAQLGALAYNEGGFLLFSALSVGWAADALARREGWHRKLAAAGAFAGFACGCKLTAVPEVLLAVPVCLVAAVVAFRLRDPTVLFRPALAGTVLFLVVGGCTFAPWAIRNIVWAGNPVFPEAAGLLGKGHFSDVQVARWRGAHSAQPAERAWLRVESQPTTGQATAAAPRAQGRLPELWRQVLAGWQFGYVLVPLGVIALAISLRTRPGALLAGVFVILAVVWLGFTHLQGRFFLLAVPLGAMAIGAATWGTARAGVMAILLLAAGWSAVFLHRELADRLYGATPLVTDLGSAEVGDLTANTREGLPPDAPLLLVGDAKAFWYPLPMSRLRYRTVFDADTSNGRGVKEAWGVGRGPPGEWVLVDPMELERFAQTYQPFPAPPPDWTARPEWKTGRPFLLSPAEARR